MPRFIYIIECSSAPLLFVYFSVSKPESVILLECSTFYPYLNVVKVTEKFEAHDVYYVDRCVKLYMEHFGINNVRGGSYTEEVLPDYKIKALLSEYNYRKIIKYGDPKSEIYVQIKDSYCGNSVDERTRLLKEQRHYQQSRSLYDKCNPQNIVISKDYIGWLIEFINCGGDEDYVNNVSKEAIRVYRDSLINLKYITKTFFMFKEPYEDSFEPKVFLHKPEFVLDTVFYHRKSITNWDDVYESSATLLQHFAFMRNYVKNRIDELEFDISTHPAFPELHYDMALRIYADAEINV